MPSAQERPAEWFEKLTPASRNVLRHAWGLARAKEQDRVHMEHLLYALLLATRGDGADTADAAVQGVFDVAGLTPSTFREAVRSISLIPESYTPGPIDVPPPLSGHAADAFAKAAAGGTITPAALLFAAVSVPCNIVQLVPSLREAAQKAQVAAEDFAGQRTNLRMLNDDAVGDDADDLLQLGDYADALAALIDNPATRTPVTLALSAPWGAGKTTLARMIAARLEGKPSAAGAHPHVTCWFNAWLHDGASDLSSAFAAEVARTANRCRPLWRRLVSPLPSAMLGPSQRVHRRWLRGISLFAVAAAVTWALLRFFGREIVGILPDELENVPGAATGGSVLTLLTICAWVFHHMNSAATSLGVFIADPQAAASSGSMDDAREQLTRLIAEATPRGSRFVVFVDDLERCRPPRAVDVLEVVNQMLSRANVVTVLLADMPAVAACTDIKYGELAKLYTPDAEQQARDARSEPKSYGWLYLQKIIQLRFDLPPYSRADMHGLRRGTSAPEAPPVPERAKVLTFDLLGGVDEPWPETTRVPMAFQRAIKLRPWTEAARVLVLLIPLAPALAARNFGELVCYPRHRRARVKSGSHWLDALRTPVLPATLAFLLLGGLMTGRPRLGDGAGRLWVLNNLEWLSGAALLALALVIPASLASYRRRVDRTATEQARREIDHAIRNGEDPLAAEWRLSGLYDATSLERLVRERRELQLANESDLLEAACVEAMKYIAPLPRATKRLLNDLRLMLSIAAKRQMLGGVPSLEPRHIGKWAAMRDLWPELSRILAMRPELFRQLEDHKSVESTLQTIYPLLKNDQELRDFFDAEPKLSPIATRLVRYERPRPVP